MTPERLAELRREAWGPGIADVMLELFDYIEELKGQLPPSPKKRMWTCGQSTGAATGCGFEYELPPKRKHRRGQRINPTRETTCPGCGHVDALYGWQKSLGAIPTHSLTPCSYHKGFKEDCGCS